MPLGQHICLRLTDNRVIAPTPHERRVVASIVLEQGRVFDLLAFGLADTHPHLLIPRSRAEAGELARRVEISLVHAVRLQLGLIQHRAEAVRRLKLPFVSASVASARV